MSSQRLRLHYFINTAAILALASLLASPPASAAGPEAPAPAELFLNTTVRHAAVEPEPGAAAAARFRVEIPQAGVLALNLSISGGAQPEPVLRVLGFSPPTRGHIDDATWWAAQTPASLLVEAHEAGTLLVEVAALEPDRSLPAFKLRSTFRAADGPFAKDVDPWDDDIGGEKPPPGGGAAAEDELCASGERDDHGDVPLCATPIPSDKAVTGVLRNDAGDDEDLFLFRLPVMTVITLEAVSDSPLQLVLRDRDGLAVATTQSESGGGPLRLARALAAGRYFLEVESLHGEDAAYALTLHRPGRP
jgi:hypothetical protein